MRMPSATIRVCIQGIVIVVATAAVVYLLYGMRYHGPHAALQPELNLSPVKEDTRRHEVVEFENAGNADLLILDVGAT